MTVVLIVGCLEGMGSWSYSRKGIVKVDGFSKRENLEYTRGYL
jgi:hypothetical protein